MGYKLGVPETGQRSWKDQKEGTVFKVIFGNNHSAWATTHTLGDFEVEYPTAQEAVEAASTPCKGGTGQAVGRFIGPAYHDGWNTPQPGGWWPLDPNGGWA